MGRIEFAASWERPFHRESDPMPEKHPFPFQMSGEVVSPLRKDVDEERSAGLQQADTLVNPQIRPIKIVRLIEIVVDRPVAVLLS